MPNANHYTRIICAVVLSFTWKYSLQAQDHQKVNVEKLVETSNSWNGTVLPHYPKGQPKVSILKYTIPPHTKLHMHKHPVINAGVLLSGKLTVISEQEDTLYLRPGDPIVELVNQWHFGRNDHAEPAEIVVFYANTVNGPPLVLLKPED